MSKFINNSKRFISLVLCTFILSVSLGSSYLSASTVLATSADVPLSNVFAALYEVFLGIGSTVLVSTGVIDNVDSTSQVDVAEFGADFLVEKMGLDVDTANILIDAFLPNAPTNYSQKYADAFSAYQNGDMSLEDFESYTPYGDSALDVYIHGKFVDLWDGITSFVDDVISGSNSLALGGHIFGSDDIKYTGELEKIDGQVLIKISTTYNYTNNYVVSSSYGSGTFTGERFALYKTYSNGNYYSSYSLIGKDSNENLIEPTFSGVVTTKYNSDGSVTGTSTGTWKHGGIGYATTISANIPIFSTQEGLSNYLETGDDSSAVNLEKSFDFSDICNRLSSSFKSIASKGAYKAIDLYNAFTGTLSKILDDSISDTDTYVDAVSVTLDNLIPSVIDDVNPIDPSPTTKPSIVEPSADASVLEWLQYIAKTLSMSWTVGSDIPDFLTGIGDYVKDIPDILVGLNDGFSDVIDIGGNLWEVVARIPDIIDKQGEATNENISKGFVDVIDIGGIIAQEVAELPDIIDIARDGILGGLIDLDNSLSIPLSGVLEGINSHTGILDNIKTGVLSIPDAITSSIDKVISNVKDVGASIIDYTSLLQLIIDLLKSILQAIKDFMSWFIIDFDAIKAHLLLALQNVPAFSGFDGFLAILDRIRGSISDSYEYPKITMKTPEILIPFLKTGEIFLLDFEDYATYFLWVRTAMGFAILFGFFMWVVRDIKVELTLN